MDESANAELVRGLRDLADFYEQNPEMPIPLICWMMQSFWKKEDFIQAVRMMAHGGRVEKKTDSDQDISQNHHAIRKFGPVVLEMQIPKKTICQKVRKMVEIDVWECPDSLLGEA